MINSAGGPWEFWLEMKGAKTPVKWTKEQKEARRAPYQARWAYRRIAAGVPVFMLRNSSLAKDVLELVGFPHEITRADGIDQSLPVGEDRVTLELIRGGIRTLKEIETETEAQAGVKWVLGWHGFEILDTSQGYRPGGKRHATTRLERGTPDLYCTRRPLEECPLELDESLGLRPGP